LPDEARLIAAFGLALLAAFAATPVAIAVATRTNFRDHPAGHKAHGAPTPYLGGAAVLGGFLLGAVTVGDEVGRLGPIVAGTMVLWVLGTFDDRVDVSPGVRLTVEVAAAAGLWALDLGWAVAGSDALNLLLTVAWVVGLVNAFNLMDNADGAAATVGSITALAVATLALAEDDVALAALCLGLAGACVGFLPYNLSAPARIFLGDGGSLPIGFALAASIMALPGNEAGGWEVLLAGMLLAGLPVLDTVLVLVSRRRRRMPLFRGGRDHLAHRLVGRLPSPVAVAVALGAGQAAVAAVAVGAVRLGEGSVVAAWCLWFAAGAAAVAYLEARLAVPAAPEGALASGEQRRRALLARRSPTLMEGVFVVVIGLACGLSPAFAGYFDVSVWGPITLVLLAALLGFLVSRPALPRRSALVALCGLAALWAWSLLSAGWAESADRAVTEGNRWLLYAALLAILVMLIRNDGIARLLLGAATAGILAIALGVLAVMLVGDGPGLFLAGRLHEPLGFINGQAAVFLLGVWPLVAVAERDERHVVAALALAGAALLCALLVLSQTRSVAPACALSALFLLAVVPGRLRRLLTLAVLLGSVAVASGPLLEVYSSSANGEQDPSGSAVRNAALAALGAAALAGVLWALVGAAVARLSGEARLRARRAAAWGLAAASVIAVAVVAAAADPITKVGDEWDAFTSLQSDSGEASRLASGGGNRYDYWRIAVEQFRDEPLAGVGAGNYETTYYLERRTDEPITQPHSLELQTLAELGVVGMLALGLFVLGALGGLGARVRAQREPGGRRALIVAAGGMFAVWLAQTSVDWLHVIPGVTAIALCGAAVLVASWAHERATTAGRMRTVLLVVGVAAVLVGAYTVGRSTLAEKYRNDANQVLASDPADAVRDADRALDLNPNSLPALYVKAAAFARLDQYEDARATLGEATRLEPHDYVPWVLLGDLAVRRGDLARARRDYTRAARLNPRDESIERLSRDPLAQPGE
jgi:UDP-GlcNAc:undecaprenyl-phosphate/decaprenyl-phosphate GlcNAc-1-phosphate transferase